MLASAIRRMAGGSAVCPSPAPLPASGARGKTDPDRIGHVPETKPCPDMSGGVGERSREASSYPDWASSFTRIVT